ncbi:Solute carrier family 25 member 43, partial [Exaiptasia diaphana]
ASSMFIQTGDQRVQVKYNGMCDVFNQTVQHNGFKGLWRGLSVNLIKIVPSIVLTYLVYEQCKRVFLYQNGYTMSPFDAIPREDVDQSLLPHEVKTNQ